MKPLTRKPVLKREPLSMTVVGTVETPKLNVVEISQSAPTLVRQDMQMPRPYHAISLFH